MRGEVIEFILPLFSASFFSEPCQVQLGLEAWFEAFCGNMLRIGGY